MQLTYIRADICTAELATWGCRSGFNSDLLAYEFPCFITDKAELLAIEFFKGADKCVGGGLHLPIIHNSFTTFRQEFRSVLEIVRCGPSMPYNYM